ncbi:hypothetical protein JHK85_040908 [Glycine max]|nr:hypothetical protein JHK85_040908 [Glycine max]
MVEPDSWNPILDRLKVAIAHFVVTQASMATKLDVLLLKMDTLLISQNSPSSSSMKAPPTHAPMWTPPPMSILPPCLTLMQQSPTLAPMPTPPPMSIPIPCPTLMQQSHAPLLALLPMAASHLPDLNQARTPVSFDNLFNVVVHYGHATTPNGKTLEERNMALLDMGAEYYGSAMAARKHQPTTFALWMAAKPGNVMEGITQQPPSNIMQQPGTSETSTNQRPKKR